MAIEEESANNVRIGILGFFGPLVTHISSIWGHRSEMHRTERAEVKAKTKDGVEARSARQVRSIENESNEAKANCDLVTEEMEQTVKNCSLDVDSIKAALDAAEQHSFTDSEFGIAALLGKATDKKREINIAAAQIHSLAKKNNQAEIDSGPKRSRNNTPKAGNKKSTPRKPADHKPESTGPDSRF